jgi:hypothetical protein
VVARKVWVPLFTPAVYTRAPARMAAFSAPASFAPSSTARASLYTWPIAL